MLNDILDERVLNIRRIGDCNILFTQTGLQTDGVIVEHRETDLSLRTDYLDTILTGALMSNIAPRATARHTILKTETGTHGILCIVIATPIASYTTSLENHTEHILKKIQLMWTARYSVPVH